MLFAHIKLNFHYAHVVLCYILFLVSRHFLYSMHDIVANKSTYGNFSIIHVCNPFSVIRVLEMLELNHVLKTIVCL